MRRVWDTIDRWGPGVIAIAALFGVCIFGWQQGERVARLEGEVNSRVAMEGTLRIEIQTWQAYVVNLKETMIKAGIKDIPVPPKPPENKYHQISKGEK